MLKFNIVHTNPTWIQFISASHDVSTTYSHIAWAIWGLSAVQSMFLASKKAAGWELISKDNSTAREGSPVFDTTRKRWNRRAGSKARSEAILTSKLFSRDLALYFKGCFGSLFNRGYIYSHTDAILTTQLFCYQNHHKLMTE